MEPVLTPQQRQREQEANHEQEHEHEHMKRHQKPRCLKWGGGRAPFSRKDKRVERDCQASGREVRIVHHRESLYLRHDYLCNFPELIDHLFYYLFLSTQSLSDA